MTTPHKFTRALARKTSTIEFRHTDGSVQGGVVNGTVADTFSVTSLPRYGDTKGHRFRYEDVAEVLEVTPRQFVSLPTFDRLMGGGR